MRLEDGSHLECRILGRFRLDGQKLTNPVAVGDLVEVEKEDSEEMKGMIRKILPRKNYVVRQSPRKKHNLHLLASNIDQAVLVVTIKDPDLKQGFIDRFLLMTEPHDIPVIIVFNKSDVYDEGDLGVFAYLEDLYQHIGYEVLLASALNGEGLEELKSKLENRTTLMSGQSGVGKSSLINAIQPHLALKTGVISNYTGKGQHTTTFAEMHNLDFGGYLIDTPGIKTLAFNNLSVMDVAHNFRELFEASKDCKYTNCTHRNEPGCAVKQGVEDESISELRYMNYLQILEEVEDQNYWERHKDL